MIIFQLSGATQQVKIILKKEGLKLKPDLKSGKEKKLQQATLDQPR